jgi:hypothetical protein
VSNTDLTCTGWLGIGRASLGSLTNACGKDFDRARRHGKWGLPDLNRRCTGEVTRLGDARSRPDCAKAPPRSS